MDDIFYGVFVLVLVNVWCIIGTIAFANILNPGEQDKVDECVSLIDMILWPMIIISLLIKRAEVSENE